MVVQTPPAWKTQPLVFFEDKLDGKRLVPMLGKQHRGAGFGLYLVLFIHQQPKGANMKTAEATTIEFKEFDSDDYELFPGVNSDNPEIAYVDSGNGVGIALILIPLTMVSRTCWRLTLLISTVAPSQTQCSGKRFPVLSTRVKLLN